MSKLVVGIDARELIRQPAGKGLHLWQLMKVWAKRDLEMHLYIKEGTELPPHITLVAEKVHVVAGRGIFWHRAVAKRLKEDGIEVFYAGLSYQSAIFNRVPTVTSVPDLIALVLTNIRRNRKAVFTERLFLKSMLKRTKGIICVSEATARDLEKVAGPINVPVVVTLLAPESRLTKMSLVPLEQRQPTILFVGTMEPRKNVTGVLRAFAGLEPALREQFTLNFAGKSGWGGEDYPALARELGIENQVNFLGYITDEERERLYSTTRLLFYPSWYEGFGLPVIEAMAHGTPVVTSNTSSLPEVVGETGIMCDPADVPAMTAALTRFLTDDAFWKEQQLAAFERSLQFSWETAALQTEELLRKVCGSQA